MAQPMSPYAAAVYISGVVDQLAAAIRDGDADAADRIVDQVDADGHQDAAAALAKGLANTSLGDKLGND